MPTIELESKKKTIWILPDAWSIKSHLLVIIESIELDEENPCVCIRARFPRPIKIPHHMNDVVAIKNNCFFFFGETDIECILKISLMIETSLVNDGDIDKIVEDFQCKMVYYQRSFSASKSKGNPEMLAQYKKDRDNAIGGISFSSNAYTTNTEEKKFSTSSALSKHRLYTQTNVGIVQLYLRSLSINKTY